MEMELPPPSSGLPRSSSRSSMAMNNCDGMEIIIDESIAQLNRPLENAAVDTTDYSRTHPSTLSPMIKVLPTFHETSVYHHSQTYRPFPPHPMHPHNHHNRSVSSQQVNPHVIKPYHLKRQALDRSSQAATSSITSGELECKSPSPRDSQLQFKPNSHNKSRMNIMDMSLETTHYHFCEEDMSEDEDCLWLVSSGGSEACGGVVSGIHSEDEYEESEVSTDVFDIVRNISGNDEGWEEEKQCDGMCVNDDDTNYDNTSECSAETKVQERDEKDTIDLAPRIASGGMVHQQQQWTSAINTENAMALRLLPPPPPPPGPPSLASLQSSLRTMQMNDTTTLKSPPAKTPSLNLSTQKQRGGSSSPRKKIAQKCLYDALGMMQSRPNLSTSTTEASSGSSSAAVPSSTPSSYIGSIHIGSDYFNSMKPSVATPTNSSEANNNYMIQQSPAFGSEDDSSCMGQHFIGRKAALSIDSDESDTLIFGNDCNETSGVDEEESPSSTMNYIATPPHLDNVITLMPNSLSRMEGEKSFGGDNGITSMKKRDDDCVFTKENRCKNGSMEMGIDLMQVETTPTVDETISIKDSQSFISDNNSESMAVAVLHVDQRTLPPLPPKRNGLVITGHHNHSPAPSHTYSYATSVVSSAASDLFSLLRSQYNGDENAGGLGARKCPTNEIETARLSQCQKFDDEDSSKSLSRCKSLPLPQRASNHKRCKSMEWKDGEERADHFSFLANALKATNVLATPPRPEVDERFGGITRVLSTPSSYRALRESRSQEEFAHASIEAPSQLNRSASRPSVRRSFGPDPFSVAEMFDTSNESMSASSSDENAEMANIVKRLEKQSLEPQQSTVSTKLREIELLRKRVTDMEKTLEEETRLKESANKKALSLNTELNAVNAANKNAEQFLRRRTEYLEAELESERAFAEKYTSELSSAYIKLTQLENASRRKDMELEELRRLNLRYAERQVTLEKELRSRVKDNFNLRKILLESANDGSSRDQSLSTALTELKSLSESFYLAKRELSRRQDEIASLQYSLDDTSSQMIKISNKAHRLETGNAELQLELKRMRAEKETATKMRRSARGY
eukprot:scaffold1942_cov197-Alexandrium_tamarense.AAC.21